MLGMEALIAGWGKRAESSYKARGRCRKLMESVNFVTFAAREGSLFGGTLKSDANNMEFDSVGKALKSSVFVQRFHLLNSW